MTLCKYTCIYNIYRDIPTENILDFEAVQITIKPKPTNSSLQVLCYRATAIEHFLYTASKSPLKLLKELHNTLSCVVSVLIRLIYSHYCLLYRSPRQSHFSRIGFQFFYTLRKNKERADQAC